MFDEGQRAEGEWLGRLLIDLNEDLDADVEYTFGPESGLPVLHDGMLYRPPRGACVTVAPKSGAPHGLDIGIPLVRDGAITVVETRQSVDSLCCDDMPAVPLDLALCGNFGWAAEITDGLSLMAKVGAEYDAWVRRLLGTLILTERLENRTCSGSWSDSAATVYMSRPNAPLEVGEVLVHECAHQHFHLAMRVAPMKKLGETGLYFSPPVGRNRPLDMILIAYHAFANVL